MKLEEDLLLEAYDKELISYEDFLAAQRDLRSKYADQYMPDSAKPSATDAGGSAERMAAAKEA